MRRNLYDDKKQVLNFFFQLVFIPLAILSFNYTTLLDISVSVDIESILNVVLIIMSQIKGKLHCKLALFYQSYYQAKI